MSEDGLLAWIDQHIQFERRMLSEIKDHNCYAFGHSSGALEILRELRDELESGGRNLV